jgi:hypothetical protein
MHHRLALCFVTLGLFAAACGGSSGNDFDDGTTGGSAGSGASAGLNGGSAGHGAGGASAGSSAANGGASGTSSSAGASNGGASGGTSGSAGTSATAGSSGERGGAAGVGAAGAAAGMSSGGAGGASGSGGNAGTFGLGGRTAMGGRFGGGGRAQGGMGGLGLAGMSGMGMSGAGANGCPASGHVSYTLTKNANPSADEQQAYMLITEAMDKAVQYYNCYTNITKADTVTYVPSVETADGNSNGSIRFGGKDYMEYITAMHEIAHTVGIGTASNWGSMVQNGIFTGEQATAKLRSITGVADDQVHADTQHFWPYGLNYTSEVKSEADVIDHCYMVVAIRADLGLH